MSQYGTIDRAFAGMKAEHYQFPEILKSGVAKQAIDFGMPLFSYLGDGESIYNYFLDTAKIVLDADFGGTDAVQFTVNGVTTATVTFTVDHDTTMDLCIAAIKALSIPDTVLGAQSPDAGLLASDTNNRTIYIRIKGLTNTTTMADIADAPPGETITTQSDQVFRGMARHVAKYLDTALAVAGIPVNDSISIVEEGFYWGITNELTILSEDICNLDNSGAGIGKFTNIAGDTISCLFRSNNYTQPALTDYLAVIQLKGVVKLNTEIVWE